MEPKGTITINIEGETLLEVRRYEEIFNTLIVSGALKVRSGITKLHFDRNGVLGVIQVDYEKWRKIKEERYG